TTSAVFSTEEGLNFAPAAALRIPLSYEITHVTTEDAFPTGYRFVDVEKITSDAGGTLEYTGWVIDEDSQTIDWSNASTTPAVGSTYHVWPDTTVTARIMLTAAEAGADY